MTLFSKTPTKTGAQEEVRTVILVQGGGSIINGEEKEKYRRRSTLPPPPPMSMVVGIEERLEVVAVKMESGCGGEGEAMTTLTVLLT